MHKNKPIKIFLLSIVSGLFLMLLFIDAPAFKNHRLWSEVWNLGHIASFYAWAILLLTISKRFQSVTFHYQLAIASTAILTTSIIIEAIQYNLGRTASASDIFYSLQGGLLAIVFCSNQTQSVNKVILRLYKVSILFSLLLPILLISKITADEVIAHSQFPILSNLETPFEVSRWQTIQSKISVINEEEKQNNVLKVELSGSQYSGLTLEYFKSNWKEYKELKLKLFLIEGALELTVSIHDRPHELQGYDFNDRFTKKIYLKSGWNSFEIPISDIINAPAGRKTDITKIKAITITSRNLSSEKIVFLDDVQLTH